MIRIFIVAFCILFTSHICHASNKKIFDWEYVDKLTEEGFLLAGVADENFNTFSQLCLNKTKNCVYLLNLSTKCEKGHSYPVLINSDVGSSSQFLVCNEQYGKNFSYIFNDFIAIDKIAKSGTKMSLALAINDDNFIIYKFSLHGAKDALEIINFYSSIYFNDIHIEPENKTNIEAREQKL